MGVKVFVHPQTEKDAEKLPKNIRNRLAKALLQLTKNPLLGIPLKGQLQGSRKIRLGGYRIVYQFTAKTKTVIIYRIEPRQSVYKK